MTRHSRPPYGRFRESMPSAPRVPLSKLKPAPWNPRTISDERFQNLCRSIEADPGLLDLRPILARQDGTIYGGNMRYRAVQHLGWPDVPADLSDVSDRLAKERALRDNGSWGEWTDDLSALLAELKATDSDLDLLGFPEPDLDRLLAEPKVLNEDDADLTPPDEPITKPGDLWLLGEHRLLCGDATNAGDVQRLLNGNAPEMMVTDPPYGVNYQPGWRSEAAAEGYLAYAARRVGEVPNDDRSDWSDAWKLFPGNVVYAWHPPGATSLVHASALQDSGFTLRMQIIWAKSNFPISRGDYHVRHEPCWYAVRTGKPARRTDDRTQTTLWEINLDRNVEGGHSTQKPVECMARPIRNHEPCDVYDPFVGSGTTLVAAEQLDRRCFAMDISPAYCDVTVRRWEAVTGRKAVLDGALVQTHA